MAFADAFRHALGLGIEPKDLSVGQVCLRLVVVFIATLILVRIANRRFLAKLSAFDAVVGFILASMLARAVNGSAAFFPSLVAGFLLIFLHHLLAIAAYHWGWFGALVKGEPIVLARDGKLNNQAMRRNKISEHDLLEEARLNGQVRRVDEIQLAMLERNGKVSILPTEENG